MIQQLLAESSFCVCLFLCYSPPFEFLFFGFVEAEHAAAGRRIEGGSSPTTQFAVAILRAIFVTGKRPGLSAKHAIPACGWLPRHRSLRER